MRYRVEVLNDRYLLVDNVETGMILGGVISRVKDHPDDPDREIVSSCTVMSCTGVDLATIMNPPVPSPLSVAVIAVASQELDTGYSGLRLYPDEPCLPNRIEQLLGTLIADTCAALARGSLQFTNGGVEADTKESCIELIMALEAVWYASRFGSFDDQTWADDLYFTNTTPSGPRLSFAQAAALYGMKVLRKRFPDITDDMLEQVLSWPLELLSRMVGRLFPAAVVWG